MGNAEYMGIHLWPNFTLAATMRPGNTLLLLLAISSALLPLASPPPVPNVGSHGKPLPPVDPRIVPFCNQTHHPEICINSARLYAGKIHVVAARTKAMSQRQTSDKVLTCIKSCLQYYNDAMDSTKEGVEAFVARDVGTFVTRFSSAITMFS